MSNFMFKRLTIFLIFIISVASLSAQSLKDNPDYIKSIMLKKQSEKAFDDGDYTESTRLANESILYAKKSDKWIAMMLQKYHANSAIKKADRSLARAIRLKGEKNFTDTVLKGKDLLEQANNFFGDENYSESYRFAKEAYETLKVVQYIREKRTLPAAYLVRDIPGNEDCLWKIAGYDFIFGDALQWKILYQANKDILPEIENPDLIVAGLVLQIPSVNGENRSGTWINGSIQ